MESWRTTIVVLALAVAASLNATPASTAPSHGGPGERGCARDTVNFPSFPSIEPNVAFWTRVFGEWSQRQVVVHDLEHPAVVYEVVTLPGPLEDRYTEEQSEFVERLKEAWQDRLRDLERKIDGGRELDEADKRLALEIAGGGGSTAHAGAGERVRTQRGLRERFRRGLEIAARYEPAIRELFVEAGLPADLAYLPHVESSFQAAARSSAGAVGVWQFTRATGRRFLTIDAAVDERLDPLLAARGAARYLAEARAALGDWALALTSYNHGLYGMIRAAEQHGGDYERVFRDYRGRLFGFASKNFYAEFLAARDVACDAAAYFPEGLTPEAPHDHEALVLEGRAAPSRLAQAWGVPLDRLVAINPSWSRRAVEGAALPRGSTVWLPAGTLARMAREGNRPAEAWAGAPPGEEGTYVVLRGDTLSTIARAHGLDVDRLRELNHMPAGASLIRAGQRLRVADAGLPDMLVHIVRRGDTLWRIAVRYGVAVADLLLHNGLTVDAVIHPGQRLRVPVAR